MVDVKEISPNSLSGWENLLKFCQYSSTTAETFKEMEEAHREQEKVKNLKYFCNQISKATGIPEEKVIVDYMIPMYLDDVTGDDQELRIREQTFNLSGKERILDKAADAFEVVLKRMGLKDVRHHSFSREGYFYCGDTVGFTVRGGNLDALEKLEKDKGDIDWLEKYLGYFNTPEEKEQKRQELFLTLKTILAKGLKIEMTKDHFNNEGYPKEEFLCMLAAIRQNAIRVNRNIEAKIYDYHPDPHQFELNSSIKLHKKLEANSETSALETVYKSNERKQKEDPSTEFIELDDDVKSTLKESIVVARCMLVQFRSEKADESEINKIEVMLSRVEAHFGEYVLAKDASGIMLFSQLQQDIKALRDILKIMS